MIEEGPCVRAVTDHSGAILVSQTAASSPTSSCTQTHLPLVTIICSDCADSTVLLLNSESDCSMQSLVRHLRKLYMRPFTKSDDVTFLFIEGAIL